MPKVPVEAGDPTDVPQEPGELGVPPTCPRSYPR